MVLRTEARKLTTSPIGRPVAVTHVAQVTCPTAGIDSRGVERAGCAWLGAGCYGESGPEGMVTRRLAASELAGTAAGLGGAGARGVRAGGGGVRAGLAPSEDARALWVSLAEARAVWAAAAGALPGRGRLGGGGGPGTVKGVPLRLHVVGDVGGALGALALGRAARGWLRVGGGPVWTYSHRWREVARFAWGPAVSVLASCETDADIAAARGAGYAVALVRGFKSARPAGGVECPQQRLDSGPGSAGAAADCASCLACTRDTRLRNGGRYIVLSPHGSGAKKITKRLAGAGGAGQGEGGPAVSGSHRMAGAEVGPVGAGELAENGGRR